MYVLGKVHNPIKVPLPGGSGNDIVHLHSLLSLGWEEVDVDVWENTSWSDGGGWHKSVELFIVADSELDVSWHNSGLLVVLGGVASELENLSGEVLKDGSKVHWGTSTDSLGVASLFHESSDSSDWELKSSFSSSWYWAGSGFAFATSSSFASGHFNYVLFKSVNFGTSQSAFKVISKPLENFSQLERSNLPDILQSSDLLI